MSCITKQHIGKYTYLYESTSYRNAEGKARNKKVVIGKIDPKTGQVIYKDEYLKRMEEAGTPIEVPTRVNKVETEPTSLTDSNISLAKTVMDSCKHYGSFYLFRQLAEDIGLLPLLRKSFFKRYAELFTLACYLVESQEPLMYFEDWLKDTEAFPLVKLNSQRISELLSSISSAERNAFFLEWLDLIREDKYFALDITSISSYSKLIAGVEWGYNRDGEDLPQINLCMLFGEGSMLPLYQTSYHGSIKDVSTLKSTLGELRALAPEAKLRTVMDKGFYSKKNVDELLSNNINFLIAVPFSSKFAKDLVESERKNIDQLDNTIITTEGAIRGVHKMRTWHTKANNIKLHAHVYFNPVKAAIEKNKLFAYVTELKQEAERNPDNAKYKDDFNKYLNIRKSAKGCKVTVKDDVVENKLRTCGWLVLLSDTLDDPKEALEIYRTKDVVEKSFDRLKNMLDLNRLRVQNDTRMENKLFLAFLALVLISALHKRMKKAELYQHYTMHELLLTLRKLKISRVNGQKIMQPLSKEQENIFEQIVYHSPVG